MANVAARAEGTIHIQWLRSGIGFPRRQKEMVRSLGLRRLRQVVERPDTPQIRGLVAAIPHLVKIVEPPVAPAWAAVEEYGILPPEVAPAEAPRAKKRPAKPPEVPAEAAAEAPAEKAKAPKQKEKAAAHAPAAKGAKAHKAAPHKEKHAKAAEGKKTKAASKAKAPKKSKK